MIKALACAFAIVIALVPVVNDVCGLGCIQQAAQACPLHPDAPTAPQTCRHDHHVASANLERPAQAASPLSAATAVVVVADPLTARQSRLHAVSTSQSPPQLSFQSIVLRI